MPAFLCIAYGDDVRVDEVGRADRTPPIAAMSCLEAVDMDDAVRIASERSFETGPGLVEIWPLGSPANA